MELTTAMTAQSAPTPLVAIIAHAPSDSSGMDVRAPVSCMLNGFPLLVDTAHSCDVLKSTVFVY